jgi:prepilin-type N-terminal cleavage/methylation domain-containing protein
MTVARSMRSKSISRSLSRMRGFTLFELLVAVAILAALAGLGAIYLGPTLDAARQPITQYGMREVAAAIMRFRQDTGFWPRTGPHYELTGIEGAFSSAVSGDPCPPDGLNSPANLCQLLFAPDSSMMWNQDTRRGWRGPYLAGFTSPWVVVSAAHPATAAGVTTTASGTRTAVPGIADGFRSLPQPLNPDGTRGLYLTWVNQLDTSTPVVGHGNPLLFFPPGVATRPATLTETTQLEKEGCNTTTTTNSTGVLTVSNAPCLISLGPDGIYGTNDDEVFNF